MEKTALKDVQNFCTTYGMKIFLRGVVSLGILLGVVAIVFAITPRNSMYNREILITLQEKAGQAQYPNGKPFSFTDIVAPSVLDSVYRANSLAKVMKFSDFCDRVKIGGIDCTRAKLDAEYKTKLGKRNLTSADAAEIERAYQEAIAALPSNIFAVQFRAPSGLSAADAALVVDAIPETWFTIASTLEAETFPTLPRAEAISKMKADIGKTSSLAQVEQVKTYISQLQAVVRFLTVYGQNRNFTLPSGETVRDVQNALEMLMTYDINLLQYALVGNSVAVAADEAFVNGNLLYISKELTSVSAKCKAISMALSRMEGNRVSDSSEAGKDVGTLQLDGAFFHEYAQLIRNDMNNKLRTSLVEKSLSAEENRSELEASKTYYELLKTQLVAPNVSNKSPAVDSSAKLSSIIESVAHAAEKLADLRDLITKDHLTSRRFYVPTGSVRYANNFAWPFNRIVIGLAALWVLYNLLSLVGLWSGRKGS